MDNVPTIGEQASSSETIAATVTVAAFWKALPSKLAV
jgi:hypothetical protein